MVDNVFCLHLMGMGNMYGLYVYTRPTQKGMRGVGDHYKFTYPCTSFLIVRKFPLAHGFDWPSVRIINAHLIIQGLIIYF